MDLYCKKLKSHINNITRTAQDYEMMLFAFRDNALQNYIYQLNDPELFETVDRLLLGVVAPLTATNPVNVALTAGRIVTYASLGSTTPSAMSTIVASLAESVQLRPRSQAFYHTTRYD